MALLYLAGWRGTVLYRPGLKPGERDRVLLGRTGKDRGETADHRIGLDLNAMNLVHGIQMREA